jgi:hypothetical protein
VEWNKLKVLSHLTNEWRSFTLIEWTERTRKKKKQSMAWRKRELTSFLLVRIKRREMASSTLDIKIVFRHVNIIHFAFATFNNSSKFSSQWLARIFKIINWWKSKELDKLLGRRRIKFFQTNAFKSLATKDSKFSLDFDQPSISAFLQKTSC